jgi:hypothetical protein
MIEYQKTEGINGIPAEILETKNTLMEQISGKKEIEAES